MKKLMIAVAIVCAAAFSQAADFNWSLYGMCNPANPDGDYLDGTVGRVFAAADMFDYYKVDSTAAVIEALTADFAKGDFASWNSYGMQELALSEGDIKLGSYGSKTAGTYDWFAVILDTDSTDTATQFFVTNVKGETIADGEGMETSIKFGDQETRSYETSNWTAVSNVPEPTSGLLLLLGVAGLALKRRRA